MIVVVAVRSLVAHPIRSIVLACGFGLGVAVMASLLGIGEVILEQARSPALAGGGDVLLVGETGVRNARHLLAHVLGAPPLDRRVRAASPARRASVYVVEEDRILPIVARAGIPSLERAIGDPETAGVTAWTDTPADAAWTRPEPADLLRAMDRFHPIPDVPARAGSWAEWLYFNGRAGPVRFYLTFLVGPARDEGRRAAGVRLQLDRAGRRRAYSFSTEVEETAVLRDAPELTIGPNQIQLDDLRYVIHLELPAEDGVADTVTGDFFIEAVPGRAVSPFAMRGSGGWVLGYTVPVMSGRLGGYLQVDGSRVSLDDGTGYHDHNWGFWSGVTWQWGQVEHEGLSFVYGRVRPPADAADPARVPGLLVALGPEGPLGYATDVTIVEEDVPGEDRPASITVRGEGRSLDLTLALEIEGVEVTRMDRIALGEGHDFFQLRAQYHVKGRVGKEQVDFTAPGAAETFRGR